MDSRIAQKGAIAILDDLVNGHVDPSVRQAGKADRRHGRVNLRPLSGPVAADGVMTVDVAALPSVGPVDVIGHPEQDCVDVACVEIAIYGLEHLANLCVAT